MHFNFKKNTSIFIIILLLLIATQSIITISFKKQSDREVITNKIYINSKGVEIPEDEYQNLLLFFNKKSINTMDQELFDKLFDYRKGKMILEYDANNIPIISSKDANNKD